MKQSDTNMSPMLAHVPRKGPGMLFRNGTAYQAVAALGGRKPIRKETLVRQAVRITGKTEKCIWYIVQVLCNPKHKTNHGRVHNHRGLTDGRIQFVCGA